jgi:hypothetical protein
MFAQGLAVCPQSSSHDQGTMIDGSSLDVMMDAAMMLACVALHLSGNNLRNAKRWLQTNFISQVGSMIAQQFDSMSLVPVDVVQWFFSAAVSNWLVSNGVVERLTSSAVAEAAEMHAAIRNVIPVVAPSTPLRSPPSPVLGSPSMSTAELDSPRAVMPRPLPPATLISPSSPNMVNTGAMVPWLMYPEPHTPSLGALLYPMELPTLE